MTKKRYLVELGFGADLHGEDVTKAACRAVKDAVSRSCLCGLVEIMGMDGLDDVHVDILVTTSRPEDLDLERVKEMVPIGVKSVRAGFGGLTVEGICVDRFARDCSSIVVANAAVTVWVDSDDLVENIAALRS
jgi:uncharacterized protein (TIGR02058 family)